MLIESTYSKFSNYVYIIILQGEEQVQSRHKHYQKRSTIAPGVELPP